MVCICHQIRKHICLKFQKMVSPNITTQNVNIRKHAEQESSFFISLSELFSVIYMHDRKRYKKRAGAGAGAGPGSPHRPTPPTAHRPPSLSLLFGLSVPAQRGPPHPRAPPLPPAQAQLSASPGQARPDTRPHMPLVVPLLVAAMLHCYPSRVNHFLLRRGGK